MAIIVKQFDPASDQQRMAMPEQPKVYQFFEVEVKLDDKGIERNIPIERDRRTLADLNTEKVNLETRLAQIQEKIDAINALP